MRLTLATPDPVVTPPDIALALEHHRMINADPRQWAALDIRQFEHSRMVILDIGTIHTDGSKEQAIEHRSYDLDTNSAARYVTHVHP